MTANMSETASKWMRAKRDLDWRMVYPKANEWQLCQSPPEHTTERFIPLNRMGITNKGAGKAFRHYLAHSTHSNIQKEYRDLPKKGAANKPDTDPNLSSKSSPDSPSGENADANALGGEGHESKNASDKKKQEESLDRTTFSSFMGDSQTAPADNDRDGVIGKMLLGKYQVIELLGSGGMSRVYKAQQNFTKKTVALKLLHRHLSSNPVMMRRFQAEAQASHHLAHQHIITVYDFGSTEDNQPFIVMDYLEGRALSEIVRTWGQLSIERCLKITDQILDALEHAHESGVLHRDLKPSNIVLVPVGENTDYVKLVDFGIAKILPKAGLEAQELTQSGDVFGSPLYMSPEQCLGNMTDARSDIYSVGCLLYECLTGKPPLVGNNTLETMHKQVSEMPAGLSNVKADVRLVKQLEDIIFKAMAKAPEQRFQSALEMRKAIEQTQSEWKEGSAILAYMRRTGAKCERYLQNKIGKRWRSKVAIAVVMLAVAMHYTIMMSILYRPGSAPEISERTMPWSIVNQPLYKIVAAEKLRRLKPITDASDTEEMAQISANLAAVGQSQTGEFRSYLYHATDRLYTGDFDVAYAEFLQAITMAEAVNMSDSLDCAYLHLAAATCLFEMNELKNKKSPELLHQALRQIRDAVFVFMTASQQRPSTFAKCLAGNICARLGKQTEAIHAFKSVIMDDYHNINTKQEQQRTRDRLSEASPINFRWGGINQLPMGYQLASVGTFLLDNNDGINEFPWPLKEVQIPFEKSTIQGLPCRDKVHDLVFCRGQLTPRCTIANGVVMTYIVEAEDIFELLVGMCEQRGEGRGSLTTAVARANLGLASLKKGLALRDLAVDKVRNRQFDQAGPLFEQSKTRFERAARELHLGRQALELHLGSNHKYVAYALLNLSDAEMNMGNVNEALEARAEAQKILGARD